MLRDRALSFRFPNLNDQLPHVLGGGEHGHVLPRYGRVNFPPIVGKPFLVERNDLVETAGGFENQAGALVVGVVHRSRHHDLGATCYRDILGIVVRKFAAFRIDRHGFTVLAGESDSGLPRLPGLFDLYITARSGYGFRPIAACQEKHERYHDNPMSEHSASSLHGASRAFKADSAAYFNKGG